MGTSLAHECGQIGIAVVLDRNFSGMWLFGHSGMESEWLRGSRIWKLDAHKSGRSKIRGLP
jgi:hypothetical protein